MLQETDTKQLMSEAKFYESYSRWNEQLSRYETWDEAVSRVMDMHREFYKDKMTDQLSDLIDEAEQLYKQKYVLGAQRALQFAGPQLLKHQMRLFNCTGTYADRPEFFNELFYVLLCGAGAGFSVQRRHTGKLPDIQERKKQAKQYIVPDSIEGWSDAMAVLLSSYFVGGGVFPEYEGRKVYFDLSLIRPKNSMISGGFKAPGPEPLRRALDRVEYIIQGRVLANETRLRPIDVYDIAMHIADAVLAGGVRRSATICLFDHDDQLMAEAKTGNWFVDNPQRGRSNNSAVIVRDQVTRQQFSNVMQNIKQFGEPGFYFVDSPDHVTNPCVEIGFYPKFEQQSGWQGCNLTEINGAKCDSKEDFLKACRAGSILGTLQAGYTDFKYISNVSKNIFDREALLGVSITGWMNNPSVLFDQETQKEGAQLVLDVNQQVAELIGINPAARATCVKPSGNASVLLKTASGIHAEHSEMFLRNVQMNKESEVAKLILEKMPYMVEDSVWSSGNSDYVISFPVIAKQGSIFRHQAVGVDFLERVKSVQKNWVEYGTRKDLCVDPRVRHNVSNTCTVKEDQWDRVEEYVYNNRHYFSGISFLGDYGDKEFNQAPNTQVMSDEQIVHRYGRAALFASGLIVDTSKGFRDLWEAISVATMEDSDQPGGELHDLRSDWIRRFKKFAKNYFDGDVKEAGYCLKDVYLLHRWTKIQQNLKPINFVENLETKTFADIDTMGAIACHGGTCEISF